MISSSTQPPQLAGVTTPPVSTTGTGDVQTEKASVNPELKELQDVFSDRLEQAKSGLSQNPEAKQVIIDLANSFGLFQDADNRSSMEEKNNDNFVALALAQCNLANKQGFDKLQQVLSTQNDIFMSIHVDDDAASARSKEPHLEALERDLGVISREDNNTKPKSGSYSMGVERQGFVEKQIEEWFQEEKRQPVKDALMLLKNQMTSGADIGPIEKSVTELQFGTAVDLAKFSANFKYPNPEIFSQAREELLNKSSELEQHFANKKDLPSVLQGKVSNDIMERVINALSRPVSEMSTETLVLAAIITPYTEKDLKSYLKAAQILSLKTAAQKDNPELSNNTALAMGLERSDAMVREHFKGGAQYAASSAANELLKSLTPLPEDMAAMA
ncbi:hypothetical protein [Endozoicomonas sp. YOMI1]|uniref:hypothetical protein n=1 Tax=Endozoicomonas sp. YOMI1 TaxID=2828739 RepID=UPI0021496513|nr:hypothetical protein [Endozoicomonas sp. YOMI1]